MTKQFTVTFGVNEGYHHNNSKQGILSVQKAWRMAMTHEYQISGISVSGVFSETLTMYPTDFGCPDPGERTVTVTGVNNPAFWVGDIAWKDAVIRVADSIKLQMRQSTVTLVFSDADVVYLNAKIKD